MKEAQALDLQHSIELLPDMFGKPSIYNLYDSRRKYLHSAVGNIVFRATREYDDVFTVKTWWTSVYKDSLCSEIKYIVIALGFDGILCLPAEDILNFANKFNVPLLKFRRLNIRIRMENNRYVVYQSSNTLDVTKYFINAK